MGLTTDRNDPGLKKIRSDGQQEAYLILSDEERAKGFVAPVRVSYKHLKCGQVTTMGLMIAETYARDPKFYGGTMCCHCRTHFPLMTSEGPQFLWAGDGTPVGMTVEEAQKWLEKEESKDSIPFPLPSYGDLAIWDLLRLVSEGFRDDKKREGFEQHITQEEFKEFRGTVERYTAILNTEKTL